MKLSQFNNVFKVVTTQKKPKRVIYTVNIDCINEIYYLFL